MGELKNFIVPPPVETEESKISNSLDEKVMYVSELRERINKTIEEFEFESNIPLSHGYWSWLNELRLLTKSH